RIGVGAAIALSLGLLAGGWLAYQAVWSSPRGRPAAPRPPPSLGVVLGARLVGRPVPVAFLSFAMVVGAAFGLTHVFSGRAAFIHVGAMIGTIMVANVLRHIIP